MSAQARNIIINSIIKLISERCHSDHHHCSELAAATISVARAATSQLLRVHFWLARLLSNTRMQQNLQAKLCTRIKYKTKNTLIVALLRKTRQVMNGILHFEQPVTLIRNGQRMKQCRICYRLCKTFVAMIVGASADKVQSLSFQLLYACFFHVCCCFRRDKCCFDRACAWSIDNDDDYVCGRAT